MRPGIGEPRWCNYCRLVVKGKYVSDVNGEWLACPRCNGPVSVGETPEETTEKARVGAVPPEVRKTCVICTKEIDRLETRLSMTGTQSAVFMHCNCYDRLDEHGLRLTPATSKR